VAGRDSVGMDQQMIHILTDSDTYNSPNVPDGTNNEIDLTAVVTDHMSL